MALIDKDNIGFWIFVTLAAFGFVWLFNGIMMPFVVGFAVAYLLNPLVEKMAARKMPRWLSALVILGLFFLTAFLGILITIPVLIREMIDFIAFLPDAMTQAHHWITTKLQVYNIVVPQTLADLQSVDKGMLSEKAGEILNIGKNIAGNVLKGGLALIGFASFIILTPIIAFYMMIDWPRITAKIDDLLPLKNKQRIRTILSDIDTSLSGFIRGQLSVCFLLGAFYAIGLSLMGLQYGFFVGVASGLLSIIPYVGSIFGLVASVGLAFYQFGGWEYPLIALIIFTVGQLVEGNYLTPKLVGGSVGLHPVWVIFVLMAGGALLGLVGMMIAVPVAAIMAVLLRHAIADYKDSPYYKSK